MNYFRHVFGSEGIKPVIERNEFHAPVLLFSYICKVSACNELLPTWLSEQGTKPVVNEKNFISSLIVVIVVACCCCHCRIESSIHSNVSLSDPDLAQSPLLPEDGIHSTGPHQPSNSAYTHTLLSPWRLSRYQQSILSVFSSLWAGSPFLINVFIATQWSILLISHVISKRSSTFEQFFVFIIIIFHHHLHRRR